MNKLVEDPFNQLDAYDDQAYVWAKEVICKIDINKFKEKDPSIISVSLARIFDVFIHLTMNYNLTDFENYLDESSKKTTSDLWDRMLGCINEIYLALMVAYKDPMKIYLTLHDSILIEIEDDSYDYSDNKPHPAKIEPEEYCEDKGFSYVAGGFVY